MAAENRAEYNEAIELYWQCRNYADATERIELCRIYIQQAEEIIPKEMAVPNTANNTIAASSQYDTLKPGNKGQAVLDARMKLYELGYFSKKPTQTEYTENMKDYVKKFEKDNGLKQDGILSPEDQEVLFSL